ncbi:GDSL esterase/lipase [Ananas comosus]|uniref:GDSL esterase/lipase n=1 Tax=Ananas comosus TaxID=4615 RepID=A0A199ULI7_ANACO|nr:GDSL esterase/lipase [Ananas comosus]
MRKLSSKTASEGLLAGAIFVSSCFCFFSAGVHGAPQVPAMFVFGDSLVDDGNNNYLSDLLGLPYLPPYTSPGLNGTRLLGGVNYASAAGGILDETGRYLGDRFGLNQQVLNVQSNLNEIRALLGGGNSYNQYLARSIVVMALGSNDYINNYLLPSLYTSSYNYTPEQYANLLLNHYTRQILALYSMGLRKFLLAGVGPLGCIPSQRASGLAPADRCVDQVNQMVGFFNRGVRSLVQQLNTNHPGAIFVYGNTYGAVGDILNNPATYGFTVVDRGCCGLARNQGQVTCLPFAVPCTNRNQHVFWDAFHTTQAVNLILAQRAYTGPQNDVYPINVQQLAQL